MDISEQINHIEEQLEAYQDAFDPEEKIDLKQTIQAEIRKIRNSLNQLPKNTQPQVALKLDEFEEILSY